MCSLKCCHYWQWVLWVHISSFKYSFFFFITCLLAGIWIVWLPWTWVWICWFCVFGLDSVLLNKSNEVLPSRHGCFHQDGGTLFCCSWKFCLRWLRYNCNVLDHHLKFVLCFFPHFPTYWELFKKKKSEIPSLPSLLYLWHCRTWSGVLSVYWNRLHLCHCAWLRWIGCAQGRRFISPHVGVRSYRLGFFHHAGGGPWAKQMFWWN